MPQRRIAALVFAAVATLAACGSSDDADTGSGSATVGDATEVAAGASGQAADVACTVDRQTFETAIEAYELLNGSRPTSEQELVDAQMIREPSPNFDVSADGALVPASNSSCP